MANNFYIKNRYNKNIISGEEHVCVCVCVYNFV